MANKTLFNLKEIRAETELCMTVVQCDKPDPGPDNRESTLT